MEKHWVKGLTLQDAKLIANSLIENEPRLWTIQFEVDRYDHKWKIGYTLHLEKFMEKWG